MVAETRTEKAAHQVAEHLKGADTHAALAELHGDVQRMTERQRHDFFRTLASDAQKTASHHLPGLEIVEDNSHHIKVTEHDGESHHVLYDETADHGRTIDDGHGNRITRWSNGSEQVEYKDGKGYLRIPNGNGGYHEEHWGPSQTDTASFDRKIENDGTDDQFAKRVGAAYARIPDGVRALLDRSGYDVATCRQYLDLHPDLKGQTPRGYPAGSSEAAAQGVFEAEDKRIVVPERPEAVAAADPVGIVRHEVGHAFDDALGNYSQSKEFRDAYNRDLDKMNLEHLNGLSEEQLEYYLQDHGAGAQETFGELFCTAVGGRPDKANYPLKVEEFFPESYKLVQRKIREQYEQNGSDGEVIEDV
jgi:hypothetical protein